jgi:two-component system response regulator NreC
MTAATVERIILADDHAMFRQGVRRIIGELSGFQVVGEAGDGIELLKLLGNVPADLVLLDISMPGLRGLEAAHEIKALYPEVRILILTMHHNLEYLESAFTAGVSGFLLKEDADEELITALQHIAQGKTYISPLLNDELHERLSQVFQTGRAVSVASLTTREKEVLKLIAEGKTSKEIAHLFNISVRTVQNHRFNLMRKLNINNTAELVRYAIQMGLVTVNRQQGVEP